MTSSSFRTACACVQEICTQQGTRDPVPTASEERPRRLFERNVDTVALCRYARVEKAIDGDPSRVV